MITRNDMIEAVAERLGRKRIDLPIGHYALDDARADNASSWPVDHFPQPIRLDRDELALAWTRSDELIRAWA